MEHRGNSEAHTQPRRSKLLSFEEAFENATPIRATTQKLSMFTRCATSSVTLTSYPDCRNEIDITFSKDQNTPSSHTDSESSRCSSRGSQRQTYSNPQTVTMKESPEVDNSRPLAPEVPSEDIDFFDENGDASYEGYLKAGFGWDNNRLTIHHSRSQGREMSKRQVKRIINRQARLEKKTYKQSNSEKNEASYRKRSRSRSMIRAQPVSSRSTWERHFPNKYR